MKRFIFCLGLCCTVCLMGIQTSFAGALWDKYFGTSTYKEVLHDICGLSDWDPSYVAVGYQYKDYRYGAYIVKINNNGTKTAETIYKGPDGTYDCIAHAVVKYADYYGTYVVVTGAIRQYSGQPFDMFAVKYRVDQTFTKISENICVIGNNFRTGWDIILDTRSSGVDQAFFISGETDDLKMCVARIHNNLTNSYSWVYDRSLSSTAGYSIYYNHNYNELYVCGKGVKNGGNTQALVVRLEPQSGGSFTYIYSENYGGNYEDIGYSITQGPYTNSITVAGKYGKTSTNSDYWFLTVDTVSWVEDTNNSKKWGSTSYNEELHSIAKTDSETYVVAGKKDYDTGPNTRYYTYLSGRSSNGSSRWAREYGSSAQNTGTAVVQLTYSHHYVGAASDAIPGSGKGDGYVIRYYDYD